MEIINNFSDIFLSVWDKGILGIDFFQILIGIGIFFIFLIFRGLISKLIIKKLEIISKRTTNKLDDTFVNALEGPARFLPIVLGFFIASYYMTISIESREFIDAINRTLITILIFWVIHQIIEPISYILSGLDKLNISYDIQNDEEWSLVIEDKEHSLKEEGDIKFDGKTKSINLMRRMLR